MQSLKRSVTNQFIKNFDPSPSCSSRILKVPLMHLASTSLFYTRVSRKIQYNSSPPDYQMKGQTPPPPTRCLSKANRVEGEDEGDKEEENEGGADVVDLLPRTDIR